MTDHSTDDARQIPTVGVDMRSLVGPPSGIGYFTLSMLEALREIGQTRFVGMAHRQISSEARQMLDICSESQGGPLGVWWQQMRLPRRLSKGDIDLFWSPITILPNRLPVPGIVTIHDLTVLTHPDTHRFKVRWSIVPFLGRTVRLAKGIAVDSKATANDLCNRYPDCSDRVHVVYPGVGPEFKPGSSSEIEATRQEIDCPEGYVMYAGTLEPRKNIDTLISAWERFQKSESRLPLLLVGPYGWHGDALLRRIKGLEGRGVIYRGRVDRSKLVKLMQAARVFVYPSLYEGFGLPPAEAMACGVPTIASNCSSLPEIVGDAGLLVDPGDIEELAAAIDRVVTDTTLATELRAAGPLRIKRFDWGIAASAMNRLFADALG